MGIKEDRCIDGENAASLIACLPPNIVALLKCQPLNPFERKEWRPLPARSGKVGQVVSQTAGVTAHGEANGNANGNANNAANIVAPIARPPGMDETMESAMLCPARAVGPDGEVRERVNENGHAMKNARWGHDADGRWYLVATTEKVGISIMCENNESADRPNSPSDSVSAADR